EQMDHRLDAVVCGVGTGGTLAGLTHFFARVAPEVRMVLADPAGSGLASFATTGRLPEKMTPWLVEGIGGDSVPPVADFSGVRAAYSLPDSQAFRTCRELLAREGIIAGTSTGTLLAAALRYCREQTRSRRVVTLVCDSGNKYLSKVYNDYWMLDQGFLERERFGDLRDLISRRQHDRAVVTADASDAVVTAYQKMRLYSISQLPVMKEGKIVGLVTEEDILLRVIDEPSHFGDPVTEAMASNLVTVSATDTVEQLRRIFDRGMVAIVMDGEEFLGLITRSDLLNWLRIRRGEKK